MSINGINGINGPSNVSRVAPVNADTEVSSPTVPTAKKNPAPEVDELTNQPLPTRFPWLSRLSHELEAASKQRPPFESAPVLGDHLDKSA